MSLVAYDHQCPVTPSDVLVLAEICEHDKDLTAKVVKLASILGTRNTILGLANLSLARLSQTGAHYAYIDHVANNLYALGLTRRMALIRASLSAYGLQEYTPTTAEAHAQ